MKTTKLKKVEKESLKQLLKLEKENPFPNFVLKKWIEDLKKGFRGCPCVKYFVSWQQKEIYCPEKMSGCRHCNRTVLWKYVTISLKWNKYRKKLIKTLEKVVERQK